MGSGGLGGGNEFYHRTAVGAADALGAQAPARAASGGAGASPRVHDGEVPGGAPPPRTPDGRLHA